MYPKIIFMDLEGTLLQRAIHLDNGKVAPSTWTLLAERLGPDALQEEQATKDCWLSGGYRSYIDWMYHTAEIHKKYGLKFNIFMEVIESVEEMPGVREAILSFHEHAAVTAIVSGGFKALADRVQLNLKIHHALAGCEYFFNPETKLLEFWNLLPSDYEGKIYFIKSICNEYEIPTEACVYIGDAKNDVPVVKEVGMSIAFNAQSELREVCTYTIDQPREKENFLQVALLLENLEGRIM